MLCFRSACESPESAEEYISAAELWSRASDISFNLVPFTEKYKKVLEVVKEGAELGREGKDCSVLQW